MVAEVSPVTGIILAGGRSSRFGVDKASFVWRGRALIEHVRAALAPVCDRVLVVGGPQADLPDDAPGAGPVGALKTAFTRLPDEALFVTGCDLPQLTPEVVNAVVRADLTTADAAVARTSEGRPQPLVARYHRRATDKIHGKGDGSLLGLIDRIDIRWVDIPGPSDWALNANRAEDLPT